VASGIALERTFFGTTSAGDAAMLDYTQESQEALERTNKTMEKAVFWGMLFAFVMTVFGMLKGMLG
jgi:hypothetical protein